LYNLTIDRGDLNDLKQIVLLNQKIFQGMYEGEPYALEHYQRRLENSDPEIYLAHDGNNLVGSSISFDKDNSFYLWIMGVSK